MEQVMDGNAADGIDPAQADQRDATIRQLRRDLDMARRENRVLKIAVAELERVAERDTLTPLYNRRFFITALHQRIARAADEGACATLVCVDINQLRAINERYGHGAGDFTLIEIARRLAGAIRGGDIAARIGGDEFGLILDHMAAEDAKGQADRFARLLSSEPIIFDGQLLSVSACFGIATLEGGMTEFDVLAAADRAMVLAKSAERLAA
jgi:diguanylate cyclase (GGDEF)-like protein